jgi:hypothetical protein
MSTLYYESKPGELEHGIFGTTKPKKNVKYIARIKMPNGKYRYFYNQRELNAYNATIKINRSVKSAYVNSKEKILDALGKEYYDQIKEIDNKLSISMYSSSKSQKEDLMKKKEDLMKKGERTVYGFFKKLGKK